MYVHCVYLYESIICLWYIVNWHLLVCSLSCYVPYTSKIFTILSHFYVYGTPEVPWWSRGRSSTESLSVTDVSILAVSLSIMERHGRNSGICQNQIFSSETKLRSIWPCAFDSLHNRELCPSLGGEKMIVLWCQTSPPLSCGFRSRLCGSPCPPSVAGYVPEEPDIIVFHLPSFWNL